MTTERWTRVAELFHEVEGLSPDERDDYLHRACGDDEPLRREVESLLSHHHRPVGFLEEPALGETFSIRDGERLGGQHDPLIGQRIGPYRIEEEIGAGGMGTVYRGARQDGVLDQTVAIKLMHPWKSSPRLVERFRREWQTLAKLSHPHIASVFDAGVTEGGTPFLIMEYIQGRPVDTYCDGHRLGLAERLELFETIAHTVHFAHQNLVVHRDLKPANILVTDDGKPVLLDFGIAKVLQADSEPATAAPTLTKMMTPDYASPEQIRGELVTTATDVYSLGVLLYELLCGRRPYSTSTTSMVPIESILADHEPARPSTALVTPAGENQPDPEAAEQAADERGLSVNKLRRQLRGDLDNIVMTALRKDPSRRYASAEQLAQDIRRQVEGHPVMARPDTLLYRTRKFVARNRWASAALLLAMVAVSGGVIATSRQANIADAEAEHARIEADSSRRIADVLTDAFLVSAPQRTEQELREVDALLNRHVRTTRRQFADQHHERANIIDALGRVYLDLNLFERASELIDEAAAIRAREFGAQSLESALSLDSQGELAYRRGDYQRASDYFDEALALHRSLPRGVHTDIAKAANDLAVTLRLRGEVTAAKTLHQEALALRRRNLGDDHPVVAESLNNLAAIHAQLEDYDLAQQHLIRVLEIRRESLGDDHPLVAQTLNNLATVALHLGRRAEAERRLLEAVEHYRSMPGTEQEGLARTLTNLANLQRVAGRCEEAKGAIAEALELHRQRLGTDRHPHVATSLQVLADTEQDLGDHESALKHFSELIEILRDVYPAGHRKIGAALCNYGSALLETGDAQGAAERYRAALATFRAKDPAPQRFLAASEFGLASSLLEVGHFEEAEPLLLAAHRRFGELDERRATRAATQLRRLYEAWGKPEQARQYAGK